MFNMFNIQDAVKDVSEFLKQLIMLFKEIRDLLIKIENDLQDLKEKIEKKGE